MIDFKNKSVKDEKIKFAKMTSDQKLVNLNFNEEGFKIAIARATRDLTARTLRNRSKNNEISLVDTLNGEGDSFLKCIREYFEEQPRNEADFDKWHNKICKKLLKDINDFYCNPDGTDVCYGKAQKILNMTLKGCYCLNGAEQKEDHFKYCHIPLDSFILEWFYREVVKWFNKKNNSIRGECITKGKICSWSVIEYKDMCFDRKKRTANYCKNESDRFFEINSNEFYHYSFIQDIIREYFDACLDENKKTPLQAEFIIWPEIQLHLSAEALFSQSIGQDEMIERINEIQHKNNEKNLKEKKDDLAKRKSDGKLKNKTLEEEIKNLEKTIDSMEEAKKIYKYLPLETKIDLLSEKIEILKNYCNSH